jgi:hypothetical protein
MRRGNPAQHQNIVNFNHTDEQSGFTVFIQE